MCQQCAARRGTASLAGPRPARVMDRRKFHDRVDQWATRLRVQPTPIRVQVMTRKWASCSSRGRVTFARDLLAPSAGFQAYVNDHNLLNLRIPNHGKRFKATLNTH